MKFEEALVELRKGKKIGFSSLSGLEISLSELYETSVTLPNGISIFSLIDFIIKGDWKVIEEHGKTFPEVFEAFKEGKLIRRKKWPKNLYKLNEANHDFSTTDLLATDWEIYE